MSVRVAAKVGSINSVTGQIKQPASIFFIYTPFLEPLVNLLLIKGVIFIFGSLISSVLIFLQTHKATQSLQCPMQKSAFPVPHPVRVCSLCGFGLSWLENSDNSSTKLRHIDIIVFFSVSLTISFPHQVIFWSLGTGVLMVCPFQNRWDTLSKM